MNRLPDWLIGLLCVICFLFGWIAKPEDTHEQKERAKRSWEDAQFHRLLIQSADERGQVCLEFPQFKGKPEGTPVIVPTTDSHGNWIDPKTGVMHHRP